MWEDGAEAVILQPLLHQHKAVRSVFLCSGNGWGSRTVYAA
jgi:hypothetical protein